jgi:ribonuclease T2
LGLLLKYWPNLYTDTQIESFWEHEWTKHGTCALSINSQIKNENDYFSVSLSLRDKFDFGPILAEAKIIPSDTLLYSLDNIISAVQAKLGVRPLATCYIQKDSNIQIFSQMQICFDKEFNLIDCRDQVLELTKIFVDNTPQETGCSSTRPVSYPTIKY